MKILLTGASGGLGSALYSHLQGRHEVLGLCHGNARDGLVSLDLRQKEPVMALAREFGPDLVLHTVGLTDVDLCDRDPEKALDINVRTSLHARLAAEAVAAKVVHISTNDVFAGDRGMYGEDDVALPVNFYSHTKLMAEKMYYGYAESLILRFTILSWYASGKTTFAAWIAKSLAAGQRIGLYADQFNSPLYVSTLAEWIEALFGATGVYHLGSERRSRWAAGVAIAEALGLDTKLIDQTSALAQIKPGMAPRPLDVSLDCSRLARDYGLQTSFAAEVAKLAADRPQQGSLS